MTKTFNYAEPVFDCNSAFRRSQELGLKKSEFKICHNLKDFIGYHFPTKVMLFILPACQDEAYRRGVLFNPNQS